MTARSLKLHDLPGWPLFLTATQAAAYVGVSPEVFQAEVNKGIWPKAVARGTKGGVSTWDRIMLDDARPRLSGLTTPPKEPDLPAETFEKYRGRFGGKTEGGRSKTRHQAA